MFPAFHAEGQYELCENPMFSGKKILEICRAFGSQPNALPLRSVKMPTPDWPWQRLASHQARTTISELAMHVKRLSVGQTLFIHNAMPRSDRGSLLFAKARVRKLYSAPPLLQRRPGQRPC